MLQRRLVIGDLCEPFLGQHMLFVPVNDFTRHGSPVCFHLVLDVPVLTQNDANVVWQGQNVRANYKQLALYAQLHIAFLLGGNCITVGHGDLD